MKQTRWILLVLLVTPLLAGCDRGEPGAMAADGEPANVVVTAPVVQPDVARFPAEVRAARKADLATRMAGTIVRVNGDVGSRVTRGDLLVLLDAVDVEARISRAGAAERQARQWHDRIQSLEADGAATPQELDDAVARLEMATASLTETEAQLSYAVLRAPFSGVITRRFAEPGDLATPGFSVLTIVAEGSIKIVADLPGELERSLETRPRERALIRSLRDPDFACPRPGQPALPVGSAPGRELGCPVAAWNIRPARAGG
jgi:RND family efflux transporter MFP subunit